MEQSVHSTSVIALGEKLVEELGLREATDTLARWMAHHIAELIFESQTASDLDRPARVDACAAAILQLWSHRNVFPNGKRPFEDLEPVLRALERLDPENTTPIYFRYASSGSSESDEGDETSKWLQLAAQIDEAARLLIAYSLAVATQNATEESRDWIELAEALPNDVDTDIGVVRVIVNQADDLHPATNDDLGRKRLREYAERLNRFAESAEALSKHINDRLAQTNNKNGEQDQASSGAADTRGKTGLDLS